MTQILRQKKSEPSVFYPEQYLTLLRRSSIESRSQLSRALEVDLSMEELKSLCRFLNCSAGNIIDVLADELKI
jgi:hypothetical protein